jgi:hypothetical protein
MKPSHSIIPLVIGSLLAFFAFGFSEPERTESIYFPSLERRVLQDEPGSFRELMEVARRTNPGERLEELADISGRYLSINPNEFLRVQIGSKTCFGATFLGGAYVDRPQGAGLELQRRISILAGVNDPDLSATKRHCMKLIEKARAKYKS